MRETKGNAFIETVDPGSYKRLTEAVGQNYRSRQRVKQRKSRVAICLLEEMSFKKFFEVGRSSASRIALGGCSTGWTRHNRMFCDHRSRFEQRVQRPTFCSATEGLKRFDGGNQFLEVSRAQPVERFEGKNQDFEHDYKKLEASGDTSR